MFKWSRLPFGKEGGQADSEPPPTQEELDLLANMEEYFETTASEISTPRTNMQTIEKDATVADALKLFPESGYSRIPVQDQTRDNIVGILFAIDLFPHVETGKKIKVSELMRKSAHMAIVVDEYGGVDGVVTITDIIEELVGDIPDESNRHSDPSWETVEDGLIVMDANYDLFEFNELFHTNFERDGIETIGGFICYKLGKIPAKGEQFSLGEIQITVSESTDRHLTKLKLTSPQAQ